MGYAKVVTLLPKQNVLEVVNVRQREVHSIHPACCVDLLIFASLPLPPSLDFDKAIFVLGMLLCNLSLWFHPHWSVNSLRAGKLFYHFSQFSRSVVSNTLRPHELQHTRLPCPSPTPRTCSNLCPLSW